MSAAWSPVWNGERWWIGCWPWPWPWRWVAVADLILDSFGFIASIPSNTSTTSFMEGRLLGSKARHFRVSCAACNAALDEYWPSICVSIMVFSFLLLERHGLRHSTRACCPFGLFVSSARRPVSSSSSTTPKPYTSLFTYKWPVEEHCNGRHISWSP